MSKPVLGEVPLGLRRAAGQVVAPAGKPAKPKVYDPPGRRTKVVVAAFFDKPVRRQLRALGVEHDKTVQALLTEAINDLFAKYRRPEIAE
jgi:Antitoxin-like ribbon-helix-helix